MQLEQLKLFNFRNLLNQTLLFSPGVNFISGLNGQGKTNLIEAIHVLSALRSFRTASLSELLRWEEGSASVFGRVRSGSVTYESGVIITSTGKELYINGERTRAVLEYLGRLITVTFTPTDLSLVKGGPQLRRRFLDRHLADSDSSAMKHFMSYQRALRQKNKLLKENAATPALLDPWNQILAVEAEALWRTRADFLLQLEKKAQAILAALAEVDGPLSLQLAITRLEAGAQYHAAAIFEALTKLRRVEIQRRSALLGPHRDDILILLDGKDSRAFASQGQSRSITLALKLAVIDLLEEKKDAPVILLDDVDSELDSPRRKSLFDLILKPGRQVFVTATELRHEMAEKAINFAMMTVSSGRVTLCQN